MHRRDLLRMGGAAAGATLVGGPLPDDATGEPAASLRTETATEMVVGKSPSGAVSDVTVRASGTVEWRGFSTAIRSVTAALQIDFDGWLDLDSVATTDASEGSVPFDLGANLVDDFGGFSTNTFSAETDGETRVRTVDLRVRATVDSDSSSAVATDGFTLRVEVTNTGAPNGAGESGGTEETSTPSVTIDTTTDADVTMGTPSG